jgi:hypothetical protein
MVGSYIGEKAPVKNEFVKHDLPTARYPNKATFLDTTVGCFELLLIADETFALAALLLLDLLCMNVLNSEILRIQCCSYIDELIN